MQDFKGRTAFVTGGASGIGLGIAQALARQGAQVAIADINETHLAEAVATAADAEIVLRPYKLDVTDRTAHADVADAVERDLGPVTIVALNAGLGVIGRIQDAGYDDWDWIMGVNLGGVINGVRTFVPRIRGHGLGGHVVATSSMGGLVVADSGGIYSAAKAGVIAMMRCLRADLEKEGIGVSVLCPAAVNTNIHQHYDMRPSSYSDAHYSLSPEELEQLKAMLAMGMDPAKVGDLVIEGIRSNAEFIMTHGMLAPVVEMRRDAILASLPDEPKNEARWQADLMARRFMDQSLA